MAWKERRACDHSIPESDFRAKGSQKERMEWMPRRSKWKQFKWSKNIVLIIVFYLIYDSDSESRWLSRPAIRDCLF